MVRRRRPEPLLFMISMSPPLRTKDDIQAILAQTIAHRLVPAAGAGRGRREQVRAMVEATPLP